MDNANTFTTNGITLTEVAPGYWEGTHGISVFKPKRGEYWYSRAIKGRLVEKKFTSISALKGYLRKMK